MSKQCVTAWVSVGNSEVAIPTEAWFCYTQWTITWKFMATSSMSQREYNKTVASLHVHTTYKLQYISLQLHFMCCHYESNLLIIPPVKITHSVWFSNFSYLYTVSKLWKPMVISCPMLNPPIVIVLKAASPVLQHCFLCILRTYQVYHAPGTIKIIYIIILAKFNVLRINLIFSNILR